MKARAALRRSVRRGALVGYHALSTVTGRNRAAARLPGLTVLLLHNTPPADVARLARFIDRHRDQVVGFDDGVRAVADGSLDRPAVALSFDDGFRSNLDAAAMLTERGVSGVFYVPTDVVGLDKTASDTFFGRPQAEGVVTWADLELLRDTGHEVGSHCRRHVPMSGMARAEAEDQLKGSVEELRSRLGSARHFAWPFGGVRHAPVDDVVTWAADVGVVAASGVRGRNTSARLERAGFLRRDAVEVRWLATDLAAFGVRDLARLRAEAPT